MDIKLNITKTGRKQKPKDEDGGIISYQLNTGQFELNLKCLLEKILEGYSFTCAYLNTPVLDEHGQPKIITKDDWQYCAEYLWETGKYPKNSLKKVKRDEIGKDMIRRYNICFTSQSLFGLDFDNEIKEGSRGRHTQEPYQITIADFKRRCCHYGLEPTIIYETFSSTAKHVKFRALFVIDEPITDYRARNFIQQALMTIFPECDQQCRDASRIFHGTRKNANHKLYSDNRLNLDNLLITLNTIMREKNHSADQIKKFCDKNCIAIVNNLPAISSNIHLIEQCKLSAPYIYQYKEWYFGFTQTEFNFRYRNYSNPDLWKIDKDLLKLGKVKYCEEPTRIDFNKLKDECAFWHEFIDGAWLYHNELFGIMTNLLNINGGRKRFFDAMRTCQQVQPLNECYDDNKIQQFKNLFDYTKSNGYMPTRCEKFCPHHDKCKHGNNMVSHVRLPLGQVEKIKDVETISFSKAKKQLRTYFRKAILQSKNPVVLIKSPTGSGKTELYTTAGYYKPKKTMIALSTHKLGEEVDKRFLSKNMRVKRLGKRPKLDDKYDKLLDIQNTQEANRYYEKTASNYHLLNFGNLSAKDKLVVDYVKQTKEIKTTKDIIITTHAKVPYIDNSDKDLIILDEDILHSLIIKKSVVSIDELNKLSALLVKDSEISNESLAKIKEMIQEFQNSTKTNVNKIGKFTNKKDASKINQIISHYVDNYKSKISSIFVSPCNIELNIPLEVDDRYIYFMKDSFDQDKIHIAYLNLDLFKKERKYIIMSATASNFCYRKLFGDKLQIFDIGEVELKGNLIQYYQQSASRVKFKICDSERLTDKDQIKKEKITKHLLEFKSTIGDAVTITYKTGNKVLHDMGFNVSEDIYFGNCAGYDELKNCGRMAVIGTPNANDVQYLLTGACLGVNVMNCKKGYVTIERNGYRQHFYTFSDNEELQQIHLDMVEADLLQAIGRARLLPLDNTVYLMSNLILPQAELKTFEWKDPKNRSE